jgi:hypothetical protein
LSESGVGLATGQVACGAVVLLPFAIAAGPLPDPVAAGPVAAMLGLGALGSGVAPLFAVLVGSAFLGGSISWNEPVGGLLVIFGVAVAQGRLRGLLSMIRPARRSGIAAGTPGD